MDIEQFKEFGRAAIEYLANYHDNIGKRPVLPSVSPGYLRPLIPESMPQRPETWQDILGDMDRVIMPGVTHWQSPGFHAYYPAGNCFPSVIGELMSAGLGVLGSTWLASPASTELELVMMDWLAKAMGLPHDLLNAADSGGGGCLQGSACEATLMALLAAKEKTVRRIRKAQPHLTEQLIKSRLVCYSSNQSNSSVEKASLLASVPIRLLESDAYGRLAGDVLDATMRADLRRGLIPCYVVATLGTTATCAFDRLAELGAVCRAHDAWLHVDAAYAGVALICPEMRPLMRGLRHADSIVTNLHKWLLVNFDCSPMWFKSRRDIEETFSTDKVNSSHRPMSEAPDLKNWQIPQSRRFRSLKVWFTLRAFGLRGLQTHIRNHVGLAQLFERLLLADARFELAAPKAMGLVCFRLKGDNKLTMALTEVLNKRKTVYMTPGNLFDKTFIRFVVCHPSASDGDVQYCIREILAATDIVMEETVVVEELNVGLSQSKAEIKVGIDNNGFMEQNERVDQSFFMIQEVGSGRTNLVMETQLTDVLNFPRSDVRIKENGVRNYDVGNIQNGAETAERSDVANERVAGLDVGVEQNGAVISIAGRKQNGVLSCSDVIREQSEDVGVMNEENCVKDSDSGNLQNCSASSNLGREYVEEKVNRNEQNGVMKTDVTRKRNYFANSTVKSKRVKGVDDRDEQHRLMSLYSL